MLTSGVEETAPIVLDRYGELVRVLRQAGTPISTNDVWIAATAAGTDGSS